MQWPVVTGADCGSHTERIVHGKQRAAQLAERIRQLGGDWDIIADNEPLSAGRYSTRSPRGEQDGCQFPLDGLAADVAGNVRSIQHVFPNVKVVDPEPLTPVSVQLEELGLWVAALRAQLGPVVPMAMHFDVQWHQPWQEQASSVASEL